MTTMTLKVSGMTCNGCARSLEAALRRNTKVKEATVSFDERTLRVTGDLNQVEVERAVADAGFEVEPSAL